MCYLYKFDQNQSLEDIIFWDILGVVLKQGS